MTQRVAVIGTGYWGKNLVRVFNELGVLAAVCDNMPGRTSGLSLADSVRQCSSPDEVFSDSSIGAVVIAAPAATHHDLCRRALEAGKDVFVEKPLALRAEEGEELVKLAEETGRVLQVGHILRYHPAVLKLKELVDSGGLGRLEYIYSNRLNLGKLRTEENILWSFAPHDISVILALAGEQPVLVSAHGEAFLQRNISDVTLTSIEFGSGVKAHTFVSWLHPFKEQRLVVVGSEQMAVFEDSRPDEKLVLYPHRVQWHGGKIPVAVKGERRPVAVPSEEPLTAECRHFLECCATRIPPRTDGWEGLAVLRVLAAAEESLKSGGKPVPVSASGNGHRGKCEVQSAKCKVAVPESKIQNPKSKIASPAFVHPTAIVDKDAELGAGTKVWHFTHVSANVKVGQDCVFGQNVFIAPGVQVGDRCKVQNNVSLYKGVRLEDDVFCGPSCVFTNVIDPRAFIEKKSEFKDTLVRKGASVGANATIVCGNTLGQYCLIGSGAVVTHDVPDYALMLGVPARQAGWVCRCGGRLAMGRDCGVCASCGDRYVIEAGKCRPERQEPTADSSQLTASIQNPKPKIQNPRASSGTTVAVAAEERS